MVILRFKLVEQQISAVAQSIVVAMTAVSEENRHNGVEDEHIARARRECFVAGFTFSAKHIMRLPIARNLRGQGFTQLC